MRVITNTASDGKAKMGTTPRFSNYTHCEPVHKKALGALRTIISAMKERFFPLSGFGMANSVVCLVD